ncbi:alpha/beta hydrolase [Mycobacterium paragordonae]|uniref:Alpha/beta hydrolase n=1 Tax=Mycobacterium paragordonae TaxID=1389713 RepID=A0AAJ1VYX8_9MYCO|nr:alpha/beta hydrolase [Mycobacterium paragordonae]MDP7733280.1 alpha/beta hydrolase [Mycobacterium paragordonae]
MKRIAAIFVALAGVLFAVNGYRPVSKRGYLAGHAFGYGLFASELPVPALAAQFAALAAITPRVPRRTRLVSWLLATLSGLGLVGLHRTGRSADEVLTAALDEGLGPDRRHEAGDLWKRPADDGATAKKPGPARMQRIWRHYAHDVDISYGEFGSRNHLDIWRRPDLERGAPAPVLLQVHGGAWMVGNKRGQAHPLMSHLAELGWICVSVNYRLSPRSTWPDQIVDVKRAIAWTKENIAEYGGDPDWIAITGGSAGGHLSSLAALTPNEPLFQVGFEEADTRVQAAIPFYGFYDFTRDDAVHPMMPAMMAKRVFKLGRKEIAEPFRLASPITHISEDAPPFFVLHGTNDSLIPVEQARSFTTRLREVSRNPVVYAELPRAQHAFDIFGSARAAHTAVAVEQFLAEVYARDRLGASVAGRRVG